MPLDEETRRFAFLLQRDLAQFVGRREEQVARGEELKFDPISRMATVQTRRGNFVGRLHGELLATYQPYDRMLRWAWAGRASSASPTHGDVVFREGQLRRVPQLSMSVVGDLTEEDATTLVTIGALVARADAVHLLRSADDLLLIGLFDRPRPVDGTRFSVPPPPVIETEVPSSPPPRAYRSIPPVREVFEPRTGLRPALDRLPPSSRPPPSSSPPSSQTKLREPARALFLPAANAALAALARGSKGYLQALFVVTLDGAAGLEKRRFVVQLVVVDGAGILRAIDPPSDVVDAVAAMVEGDRRDGQGAWRKLSARITPKPDGGATLHVDVL